MAYKYCRWGYRRLHQQLRREGLQVSRRCIERLYREEKLKISRRKKRKLFHEGPRALVVSRAANELWAMDFVHDYCGLSSKQKLKCLTVIDVYTRQSLSIETGATMRSVDVIRHLSYAMQKYGRPQKIRCDNGPEFSSHALRLWAHTQGVELVFIEPGQPTQNAYIESFNGKFRDECLNQHCFVDYKHARQITEQWRNEYNACRPHSALNYKTPDEFRQYSEKNGPPQRSQLGA